MGGLAPDALSILLAKCCAAFRVNAQTTPIPFFLALLVLFPLDPLQCP